jgi:hypothetical protein
MTFARAIEPRSVPFTAGSARPRIEPALAAPHPFAAFLRIIRRGAAPGRPLGPARLAGLWRGERPAPGPIGALIGTAALALELLGRAAGIEDAPDQARRLWRERPNARFAAA